MLIAGWLLLILSFGSTLITGQSSYNAIKLNIFSTVCGDRQDLSIATFYPLRHFPESKDDLLCSPVTPAGVVCNIHKFQDPPSIWVWFKARGCKRDTYLEGSMHVDSNLTVVPGTLKPTTGIDVQPPSKANVTDLASGISPSAALTNCASGFIFSKQKFFKQDIFLPADCIVAHTGVQNFTDHVVIGDGYSDYMTDEEIQQLPAPESRTLVQAARNAVVFGNNMFTALSNAYTDAQLLVPDMKNDLVPSAPQPEIRLNLGDILMMIGIALPVIPFGFAAPVVAGIGGALVFTGTIMNEQNDPSNNFDIVTDSRLQDMKDATQASVLKLMNDILLSGDNYTALDDYSNGVPQDLSQMQAQIKQQVVAWTATQFLNHFGLKVCDNPDECVGHVCDNSGYITACNDKIQNLDCRMAGGFSNGGGGYYYNLNNGNPSDNIAGFTKYLPGGSYDDLCNVTNGWNVQKGHCNDDDYLTYYDTDHCNNDDPPPEPPQ